MLGRKFQTIFSQMVVLPLWYIMGFNPKNKLFKKTHRSRLKIEVVGCHRLQVTFRRQHPRKMKVSNPQKVLVITLEPQKLKVVGSHSSRYQSTSPILWVGRLDISYAPLNLGMEKDQWLHSLRIQVQGITLKTIWNQSGDSQLSPRCLHFYSPKRFQCHKIWCLDVPERKLGSMVRINGLYWGYKL